MRFSICGIGKVGKWVASLLSVKAKKSEIIMGDIDEISGNRILENLKLRNAEFKKTDITDVDATVKLIKGSDVFINTAGYQFNIFAMKAALKAGVNYLDPGGLFHITKDQYKLNDTFEDKNLTALLCMGGAPGTTNIMARYGADLMDSVDEIGVYDCVHELSKGETPISFAWHIDSIIDGLMQKPIIFKDGEYKTLEPFTGKENIYLPEPLGLTEVFYRIHSEVFSLPISFKEKGIKYVYFKGGHPKELTEKVKFLIDIGLANKEPLKIKDNLIVPRDLLIKLYNKINPEDSVSEYLGVLRVHVKGKKNKKKKECILESIYKTPKGVDLVGIGTAMPLVISALMLANGEIEEKGVLFPEMCIEPKSFFKKLKRMGASPPTVIIKEPLV
ncbi:MAG: saccharopine dehydrogenase family protein [Promethearchaeia archaeon]